MKKASNKINKTIRVIFFILNMLALILSGCSNTKEQNDQIQSIKINDFTDKVIKSSENNDLPYTILNKDGTTIKTRYNPPKGFTRIELEEDNFGEYLRGQKLKFYGEKALYYDGRSKRSEGIYDSVMDIDIGTRDLHQCADAVMLLRAEYLYSKEDYSQIKFNFVSGFQAEYQKWMEGYRIQVQGNNVSWIKQAQPSNSYESFRKYMDMVFAYAGTISLEKELRSVMIGDMMIGDVFIQGGSPGHAIIVVDMAQNNITGEKVFMVAQSYMPAQQTQILINPNNQEISPWYTLDIGEQLVTPEWKFDKIDLKGFR